MIKLKNTSMSVCLCKNRFLIPIPSSTATLDSLDAMQPAELKIRTLHHGVVTLANLNDHNNRNKCRH